VTVEVLRRAVERLRFALPDGFELLQVESPALARWSVERDGARRVLQVVLREPATGAVTLGLIGQRIGPPPEAWSFPRLEPLDVAGHTAIVRLMVDGRLHAAAIAPERLTPIDVDYPFPQSAQPPAITFDRRLEPVAAYYAVGGDWRLSARFTAPPPRMGARSRVLLTLDDAGQRLDAMVTLVPKVEPRFAVDLALPAGWLPTEVKTDGATLSWESRPSASGQRVRVKLHRPAAVDVPYTFWLLATRTPPDWLSDWRSRSVEFPRCEVLDAVSAENTIAVVARDDMTVRAERLAQLTPVDQAGTAAGMAFRCEGAQWSATLAVVRAAPRLTARTFNFVRVEPDLLGVHFEIAYQVHAARTRRLALLLPADTPQALAIRGLDGVQVKESASQELAGGVRRWNVLLAETRSGPVRLAVDFQQPMGQRREFALPVVRADGVAYQSGLLAIEGSADLDVQVTPTGARAVDVGELADAQYQPGRRLLGAWGFGGAGTQVTAGARVRVVRQPGVSLPSVIVERATLNTLLSAEGRSVTTAEFRLLAKTQLLEVRLPTGSQLWSVACAGTPLAPQRDGQALLVSLPAADGPRPLRIIYETPVASVPRGGWLELAGPELFGRTAQGPAATRIPTGGLKWCLELPHGYRIVEQRGTLGGDATGQGSVQRPWPVLVKIPGLVAMAPLLSARCHLAPPFAEPAKSEMPLEKRAAMAAATAADKSELELSEPAKLNDAAELNTETLRLRLKAERDLVEAGKRPLEDPFDAASNRLPLPAPHAVAPGMSGMGPMTLPVAKPAEQPPAAPPPASSPPVEGKAALAGMRSLTIDTEQASATHGPRVCLTSLGDEPRVALRLVDQRRVNTVAWAAVLAVLLIGLILAPRRARIKARYVMLVALLATVVPLPLESVVATELGNAVCLAALALVPFYLLVGAVRLFAAAIDAVSDVPKAAVKATLLLLAVSAAAHAEPRDELVGRLLQIFEPPRPVAVPDDVILIPYDPSSGPAKADRRMLSYAKYVELWNRAYPDRKLTAPQTSAEFALAGASYRATLGAGEQLTLSGQVEIEVYVDGAVAVPLGLERAVLTRAVVDGRPAQIQSVRAEQSAPQQKATPTRAMLVLNVSGRGRHLLELELRVGLERPGGWRVARATIPSAPAAVVTLVVPQADTELRLGTLGNSATLHTERAGQQFETVLTDGGTLYAQWRVQVSEAPVDQTLKVHSTSTFDVTEEGLRLDVQLELDFRGATRDGFRLEVPAAYTLERIEGENVRGWELRAAGQRQAAEVQLLKPARDRETLRLVMVRRELLGRGPMQFELPAVVVEGAALSDGQVMLRRRATLDLRVVSATGLVRTDLPQPSTSDAPSGPLRVRPVLAYRFPGAGYRLQLASAPIAAHVSAQVQAILRVSEFEREVETRVLLTIADRPLYVVRLWVPDELEIRRVVAPGRFHWAVEPVDGRRLLCVYLGAGCSGGAAVVVQGRLGTTGTVAQVPLPRFELRDVERQQGQIAVQADPDYDLEPTGLENCRPVLLEQVFSWLQIKQRETTRLALEYRQPDYRGLLRLSARRPDVNCLTVTNVRVTDRAIEETVLLDFTVRNAGVRELSFLLPAAIGQPRIQVPMLRQQSIEPVDKRPGSPLRVRLELQAPRMDNLRVLVENDRVLSNQPIVPPIPRVETGRTERQLVAIESAGRDELVVERAEGLEPIGRQQGQWGVLTSYLRGGATLAYQVNPGAESPQLVLRTRVREAVQTVGARIWLGETTLVFDAHGAYRATVTYRLDNRTEPYLVVALPPDAELWCAHVAGEPVKPIADPQQAGSRRVLVPLVKTALGDSAYRVVIQYAGRVAEPRWLTQVDFPLVRTVNVQVARSLLRLHLPATHWWTQFGERMRRVDSEEELEAERVAADTQQTERLLEIARHGDSYAKVRASSALERLIPGLSAVRDSARRGTELSAKVAQQQQVAQRAEQELRQIRPQRAAGDGLDNRAALGQLYEGQQTKAARNVVRDQTANFADAPMAIGRLPDSAESFNAQGRRKTMVGGFGGTRRTERAVRSPWPAKEGKAKAAPADRDTVDRYQEQLQRSSLPAPGKQEAATGLTSLAVRVPEAGTLVCFTTPRGEIEMSAWALSNRIVGYVGRSLGALAIALVGLMLLRTTRRRG